MPRPPVRLAWPQVLAWRLNRQLLRPSGTEGPVGVVRRLAGAQAQVPSSTELAVAVRQHHPVHTGVATALAEGQLLRTWAMRGTLQVLAGDDAADVLSLIAAARTWHRGSWQRAFATAPVMTVLADKAAAALDGPPLTREELGRALAGSDDALAEQLRSGWGTLLKPLAWQGLLCHGPDQGRSVTFTRPDRVAPGWTGLPDPDEASRRVIRAYLSAYGPADPATFDQWLLRGGSRRTDLRRWFTALDPDLVMVDIEGRSAQVLATDLDELLTTEPAEDDVRLLPGFDPYLLGPGTSDPAVVPAAHRARVSRAGGWISPVVLHRGLVVGTWEPRDGVPAVRLFEDTRVPPAALDAAVRQMSAVLSRAPEQPVG